MKIEKDESLFEIFAKLVGVFMLGAGYFALLLLSSLPFSLIGAWARVKMWDWFVVPYLHLPHISIWVMYGLTLLIGSFSDSPSEKQSNEKKKFFAMYVPVLARTAMNLIALLLAYFVHTYIL